MPCIAHRTRPLLLQGTLTTFRRRCGKPACRCAAGEPHESPALRFTEDGRTKTLTLTAAEVAQVTAALARYEQARADLEAQAAEGIARLRGSRAARGTHRAVTGRAAQRGFGADSRGCFEQLMAWLEGGQASGMTHAELEDELACRGRELLRRMLQDHLSLRAATEPRLAAVADDAGVLHAAVETGHRRRWPAYSAPVQVDRLAYRHRGHQNLHPADAALNLPAERHSHGLRRLAAIESTRGSFEQAGAAITRATGQQVGKRQVEELTARAAVDVEDFYATASHTEPAPDDVLVISADGKGIVMRPDSLRPATAKAAAATAASSPPACPRARNATANAWPRSAPSTTLHRYPARPPTYSPASAASTRRQRHRRPRTSGSPPAWSTTPPRSSPASSTKPNDATRTIGAAGSPWSTATTTRSTASKPKRAAEGSPFPSSST